MTLFALCLVLAAACCHATWNFLVKRINGGPELVWLFSAIAMVIYLPVAVWVYLGTEIEFGVEALAFCLVSAALHLAYFLLLQQGYRKGDLSLVYPTARATGPLLSTGFAVAVLGERLSWGVALGGLAIIIGVVFLTGGFRRDAKHMTHSLAFGLGAGFLIGSYTVFDAYGVQTLLISPLLLDYTSSVLRTTALAPIAWRRREKVVAQWRDHKLAVLAIAVFNPLAYILVLVALTFTPVVYVAPLREVSVLLTVMIGTLLLGEGDFRSRIGWAALILAGMTSLSIS